jgi:hypothetical protein
VTHHGGQFHPELLPPPGTFYGNELGRLSRPSRGWAKANCPFHESKSKQSFSVNLDTGGFNCFGCGARGGDVLDFVRLRDKLDFKTAAKQLGAWQDESLNKDERRRIDDEAAKRKQERERIAQIEQAKRIRRMELRDEVHSLVEIQQEMTQRLAQLRQGAPPVCDDEEDRCWHVLALAIDDLRMTETEYMQVAELEYLG